MCMFSSCRDCAEGQMETAAPFTPTASLAAHQREANLSEHIRPETSPGKPTRAGILPWIPNGSHLHVFWHQNPYLLLPCVPWDKPRVENKQFPPAGSPPICPQPRTLPSAPHSPITPLYCSLSPQFSWGSGAGTKFGSSLSEFPMPGTQ